MLGRMEKVFQDLEAQVEQEQKIRLNQLYAAFQEDQTPDGYNRIRRQLMQEFRMYGRGRQSFGASLDGPPAGAGTYILTLTVNGLSQKGVLIVREDPLLGSSK